MGAAGPLEELASKLLLSWMYLINADLKSWCIMEEAIPGFSWIEDGCKSQSHSHICWMWQLMIIIQIQHLEMCRWKAYLIAVANFLLLIMILLMLTLVLWSLALIFRWWPLFYDLIFCSVRAHGDHHLVRLPLCQLAATHLPRTSIKVY